jgi:solute carrier family 25 (mitochondrial citrate transporter), member 1
VYVFIRPFPPNIIFQWFFAVWLISRLSQTKPLGFIGTGVSIIRRETPLGLYKGLGAVLTGIIPKMAIRFTSYEWYKQLLADKTGRVSGPGTFFGKA